VSLPVAVLAMFCALQHVTPALICLHLKKLMVYSWVFRAMVSTFRVHDLGFEVKVLGYRAKGLGFRV